MVTDTLRGSLDVAFAHTARIRRLDAQRGWCWGSVRLAGSDGEVAPVVPSRPVQSKSREGDVMVQANDYDSFAEAYSADNETNLVNGHYERPAMLNLVGEVRGRRILDAGCGSGPLAAALHARGAIVTGFDRSAAMSNWPGRGLAST